MPTVRRDFVNRTDEITQLDLVLNAEGIEKDSLVLMHGQQGIGKTQLLAKYLRLCNFNNIRIAYIDLSTKDYLGLIDETMEGLGKEGFETLEQTYDEVLNRFQFKNTQPVLASAQEPLNYGRGIPTAGQTQGLIFNQPVAGEQQIFVSGNATFNNPKITQIFNFQLTEPRIVQEQNQKKITQAFLECLRTISRAHRIAILLDHWDVASDPLKIWLNKHLLKWASEFTLRKALVVLSREALPMEFENQMGILPLAVPLFNRETALELWEKNGLPADMFNALGIEIYSIPNILALEIDKERLRQAKK